MGKVSSTVRRRWVPPSYRTQLKVKRAAPSGSAAPVAEPALTSAGRVIGRVQADNPFRLSRPVAAQPANLYTPCVIAPPPGVIRHIRGRSLVGERRERPEKRQRGRPAPRTTSEVLVIKPRTAAARTAVTLRESYALATLELPGSVFTPGGSFCAPPSWFGRGH